MRAVAAPGKRCVNDSARLRSGALPGDQASRQSLLRHVLDALDLGDAPKSCALLRHLFQGVSAAKSGPSRLRRALRPASTSSLNDLGWIYTPHVVGELDRDTIEIPGGGSGDVT